FRQDHAPIKSPKRKRPRTSVRGRFTRSIQRALRGVLVARGNRLGLARAARQREGLTLIERADAALVEAGFLDLQIGAVQRIRRQLLDREANCFGRGAKTPIGKASPLLLADRGGK